MKKMNKNFLVYFVVLALAGGLATAVYANHSWGGYHWGRTSNPFTLELGNNVSAKWDASLAQTATDWSWSSVLDTEVVAGNTNPRKCKATMGRVEVCSERYGNTGWLGIAQIWISGGHITKGLTKVNDFYFDTAKYNTPEWRNLVMCQEVGHTLGLGHQDETFDNPNLGTCMDYTSDPSSNQHPNPHDYDMLEKIYAHLDGVSTVGPFPDDGGSGGNGKGGNRGKPEGVGQEIDLDNPSAWGKVVSRDGKSNASLYARDLGAGEKLFTFVIWAE